MKRFLLKADHEAAVDTFIRSAMEMYALPKLNFILWSFPLCYAQ